MTSKYKMTVDMINKLRGLKYETKLNFHQIKSKFYDKMNYRRQSGSFQTGEDFFSRAFLKLEALLLMKFLQIKSQLKSLNKVFYDLCYAIIKNLSEEGVGNGNLR